MYFKLPEVFYIITVIKKPINLKIKCIIIKNIYTILMSLNKHTLLDHTTVTEAD